MRLSAEEEKRFLNCTLHEWEERQIASKIYGELSALRAELKQAQEARVKDSVGFTSETQYVLERQLAAAESRAAQWERKFNDDGPRCKVRTDSKEGRFIAPTDCGKEDLEQRLARVREIVAIGVNALEHCGRRHKKCNCSKEALAEIAAVLKETEEK